MKEIKIYDKIIVQHLGETEVLFNIADLWDLFHWDIENDENAKECAQLITRELICFGDFKTTDTNGREIFVKLIKEED